jgi:hypothetical protein
VNAVSSTGGGEVLLDGGSAVIARGLCWSTNPQPTIADSVSTDGTGLGVFASILNNLQPNTTYYFRAYATNGAGTGYGNELSFSTTADTVVQVGCYYRGGIVAYILQEGDPGYDPNVQHGLIAAPFDQVSLPGVPWGCIDVDSIITDLEIGTGMSNTEFITANCTETGYAAKICSDLDLNGYSDWFLPSNRELTKVLQNSNLVGGFQYAQSYWTSSASFSTFAWRQVCCGGYADGINKNAYLLVRAIRYF